VVSRTTAGAVCSPVEGMLIYDTFVNALRYYDGTSWLAVGGDSRGGAFEDAGTVVNQVGNVNEDDSIFGRAALPANGEL